MSDEFTDWLDELLEPAVEDRFNSASRAFSALTHPKRLARPNQIIQKPRHSRILLTRSRSRLFIEVPPAGMRSDNIGNYLVAIYWGIACIVGFGQVMTTELSEAPAFFQIIILIQFGGLFALITRRYLTRALGSVSFEIERSRFILTKKFLFWKWVRRGKTTYLEGVELADLYHLNNKNRTKVVTLREGVRTYKFGSMLSESEKKWLVSELEDFIQKQNGGKRPFEQTSVEPQKWNSGWI